MVLPVRQKADSDMFQDFTTRTGQVRTVTAEAFDPFGDLPEGPAETGRIDLATTFSNLRPQARINVALVRCDAVPAELRVSEMECHPFSAQAFIPLDARDYIVVVAHDDGTGKPDPSTLTAFRVSHSIGISYHVGVWHIGMGSFGDSATSVLLIPEDGTPDDCRFPAVEPFDVVVSPETASGPS
ncbi:ureidoglycolate lyase (plasmid) [Skermanella rosea]|uniref:ureidoglycolate lyase n=1 Tax=Skermanella rosea TaxID=1817965 RepID=UPI00193422CF|nr:ureidoglycolate lyase [Skermanella rosea]UEM07647.1 ureidoglycolate lyase [Skermanella rosea]